MSPSPQARRLSASDAAFLYAERDDAPMHIGAIAVVDGTLDVEGYRRAIAAKTARLARLRQKVVSVPLNLGHPSWVLDPDFDVARHVFVHEVPAPGGHSELFEAAAEVFTGPLDRSKPLWEIHLLQGLLGGRTALVSKVHHAMADGVGANELVTTLFDLKPTPPPPADAHAPQPPEPEPHESTIDAIWAHTTASIDAWSRASMALLEAGRSFTSEQAQVTFQALTETVPDLALPLWRLPFNRSGSRRRKLVGTEFSFAEARAIRGALGGTVNDVVLAALGGGIAEYCRRHGRRVRGRSMRVMVPVNVRSGADAAALGNQVSFLPVSVPLDIDDPARRLRAIHGITRILKAAKVAESLHQMASLWGAVPPALQAAFGAMGALTPAPAFNMVCTNVPGPQIRIYALELPVIAYYPSVPVGFQMGLGCAIYSYDQRLFIGLTADLAACPDPEIALECVEQAFYGLREAAGVTAIEVLDTVRRPAPAPAAAPDTGTESTASAAPPPARGPGRGRSRKAAGGGEAGAAAPRRGRRTVTAAPADERETPERG